MAVTPLLAVGSDFGVRTYAESQTAHAFQDATGTATPPKVHIRGFPFLTQATRGTVDRVDISAQQIPAGTDNPVPITKLDVDMRKLKRNSDANT
ncbi:MAG TPA: DUF2993 domain-containing protein, partial [Arthrobacter sp.]|nr:DUF2993 domain-containing protein [Arthrobacter sp.]